MGAYVEFAGAKGGNITGMGKVMNSKITMENVNYVEQLKHNLMSVSQICDKGNQVHFTKTEALVLKPGFVVPEEWILLKAPRKKDIYGLELGVDDSVEPVCLLTKASVNESILWHRRMGHINFRKMNYVIKHGLVLGVPEKRFEVEDKCVPCLKGKQTKKHHKSKTVNSIAASFELLHMDLFGPVNVRSIGRMYYCLVVTDDFSRFSWVFFLKTKDETSQILMEFFDRVENQYRTRIKKIRSDNGTEFKKPNNDSLLLKQGN